MGTPDEDPALLAMMAASLPEQLAWLRERDLPEAGLLILMSRCFNKCFFCAVPTVTAPPPEMITPWSRVRSFLAANRTLELDTLCLAGTEPTTHPEFERTLAMARKVGFQRVQLMTSGLLFGEPRLARRWASLGIHSLAVPLYSADPAVHDAITGTRNHARLVAALDTARDAGIAIHLHTLALKRTLPGLGELVQLAKRWDADVAVAPVRPKFDLFDYAEVAPSFGELAAALDGIDAALLGFPRCAVPGHPHGGALVMQLYFLGQKREFADACSGCGAQPHCHGVVRAHLALHGDDTVSPLPSTSARS